MRNAFFAVGVASWSVVGAVRPKAGRDSLPALPRVTYSIELRRSTMKEFFVVLVVAGAFTLFVLAFANNIVTQISPSAGLF
jgi:hypothetical protein